MIFCKQFDIAKVVTDEDTGKFWWIYITYQAL